MPALVIEHRTLLSLELVLVALQVGPPASGSVWVLDLVFVLEHVICVVNLVLLHGLSRALLDRGALNLVPGHNFVFSIRGRFIFVRPPSMLAGCVVIAARLLEPVSIAQFLGQVL